MCSQCALLLVRMMGTLVWEQCLYAKPSLVINLYSIGEYLEPGIWNHTDVCSNHASSIPPSVRDIVNKESLKLGSCLSGIGHSTVAL